MYIVWKKGRVVLFMLFLGVLSADISLQSGCFNLNSHQKECERVTFFILLLILITLKHLILFPIYWVWNCAALFSVAFALYSWGSTLSLGLWSSDLFYISPIHIFHTFFFLPLLSFVFFFSFLILLIYRLFFFLWSACCSLCCRHVDILSIFSQSVHCFINFLMSMAYRSI